MCDLEKGRVPVEYLEKADFWPEEHSCGKDPRDYTFITYLYRHPSIAVVYLLCSIIAWAVVLTILVAAING